MIDYSEIEKEIGRLENSKTTYSNCERLAVLYTVINARETLESNSSYEKAYSYAESENASESEFKRLARNTPADKLLDILDEHMEAIKALYPKEYSFIIEKLK